MGYKNKENQRNYLQIFCTCVKEVFHMHTKIFKNYIFLPKSINLSIFSPKGRLFF